MRTAFGSDRVEDAVDGGLRLSCAWSKGWRPRLAAAFRRAEHPGTAVRWGEELFEVVGVESLSNGGVRYSLEPWRTDLAVRSLERYDAESEAARAAEREWRSRTPRRRRLALALSPLLGHLPGEVQERMEHEFGVPANVMTVVSALPLAAIGIIGCFAGIARMAGGSLAPLPEPSLPLSLYLFGESALRIGIVVTQSRPAGSIPGSLVWGLWSELRRKMAR